jgi:NarL family two-component system response regulator YdfI
VQATAIVHVAVLDRLPMFRRGVAASLSSVKYLVEEPENAEAWLHEHPGAVVLLTLHSAADLDRLAALCRLRPRPLVVALPSADDSSLGVRAMRAGARSVVAREATGSALRRAVSATVDGETVMPAEVAGLLVAGRGGRGPRGSAPSAEQIDWLRRLSDGWTVTRLALETGYSERAMYRLLRAFYQKIGVSTRLEAIMLAHDNGWFEN